MVIGITTKLPLRQTRDEGFILIKTTPDLIQQNLKNLLLTNPGERIFDKAFGVGMKRFLFEQGIDNTNERIKTKIRQQVKKYMPFINIQDISFAPVNQAPNVIYIEIRYVITPLNQANIFRLEIR